MRGRLVRLARLPSIEHASIAQPMGRPSQQGAIVRWEHAHGPSARSLRSRLRRETGNKYVMQPKDRAISRAIATQPTLSPTQALASEEPGREDSLTTEERRAAEVLIRHLFAPSQQRVDGLEYAVAYRLADGAVGGDIVDVYHFDNGNVAIAIADISGKGAQAAIHAALVKYGLRCYASEGLTPERVLRSLDRVFIENNAFERTESFASVFLAIIDVNRRAFTYCSAGHEPIFMCCNGAAPVALQPTAPLVGVFDDQHHLFKQCLVEIAHGTILVGTTDGVTESRDPDGNFYGMARLRAALEDVCGAATMAEILDRVLDNVRQFTHGVMRDDIAAFAVKIL